MTLAAPDPAITTPAEAELIAAWWGGLPTARRRQLLSQSVGTPLPRSVAAELSRRGVNCPLVLVAEDDRLVRRALPSAALVELLARERTAAPVGADRQAG